MNKPSLPQPGWCWCSRSGVIVTIPGRQRKARSLCHGVGLAGRGGYLSARRARAPAPVAAAGMSDGLTGLLRPLPTPTTSLPELAVPRPGQRVTTSVDSLGGESRSDRSPTTYVRVAAPGPDPDTHAPPTTVT